MSSDGDSALAIWPILIGVLCVCIALAVYLDRDRTWVFSAPWNIHLACDEAYRQRKNGQQLVKFRWFTQPLSVISDPRKASRIVSNDSAYSDFTQDMWDALWDSRQPLLLSGNAAHKTQRKHASFMLGPEFAEQVRSTLRHAAEKWVDDFFDGEQWTALNVHGVNELTWRMITSITTGADTPPEFRAVSLDEVHNARTAGLVAAALGTSTLPVYAWFARRLKPEHGRWTAFIRSRIREELDNGAHNGLLLERLCQEPDMDEDNAFGIIAALHVAGHHAPAAATTFALYHILRDDKVKAKVLAELDNSDYLTQVTRSCAGKMPASVDTRWCSQVLHETVRLYPGGVVSRFFTALTDDDTFKVRRGETVIVPWYSFHRDPKINADPERFDPERTEAKGSFFPFGYGRHSCIGQRLVRPMFEEVRGAARTCLASGWSPARDCRCLRARALVGDTRHFHTHGCSPGHRRARLPLSARHGGAGPANGKDHVRQEKTGVLRLARPMSSEACCGDPDRRPRDLMSCGIIAGGGAHLRGHTWVTDPHVARVGHHAPTPATGVAQDRALPAVMAPPPGGCWQVKGGASGPGVCWGQGPGDTRVLRQ